MKHALFVCLLFLAHDLIAQQEPKRSIDFNTEIVFGQSGSFSGHFSYYGAAIRDAINACFAAVNEGGGINGKKLRLISLDDHGDAEITKKNIELLRDKYGITMFIGVMGTRGILAVFDLIKDKKIGMYFPWGNDKALSDPALTYEINGSGLLGPQVDKLAHTILHDLKYASVAVFHADDSFSTQAAEYLVTQLKKGGTTTVSIAHYNRFTMNIATPADELIKADPRAIICIATSMPTVRLITHFWEQGYWGTKFFGVDSTFLVPEILKNKGVNFSFVSAVPDPHTSDLQIAAEYRSQLAKFVPEADISTFSFSYYISARILCEAMLQIKGPLNNTTIIKQIESFKKTKIKGFEIDFDASNRYVFGKNVWLIS